MNERKQGRRSAETAEQTKQQILKVAEGMFCELGYERVSLRQLSENAGVSHSLIRHHFGSKEKIWQSVNDSIDLLMLCYIARLIEEMPNNMASNLKIYRFMVQMLAFILLTPQPIQMIADAIRQDDDALLQYFLKSKDKFEAIFSELFAQYNLDFPHAVIDPWEAKWQMLIFAHGATSLAPILKETWENDADAPQKLLLNHWGLFNNIMARQFSIPDQEKLRPNDLNELLLNN